MGAAEPWFADPGSSMRSGAAWGTSPAPWRSAARPATGATAWNSSPTAPSPPGCRSSRSWARAPRAPASTRGSTSHTVARGPRVALERVRPEVLVVDTFPRGLGGELAPLLPGSRRRKVLVHRDLHPDYVERFGLGRPVDTFDRLLLPGESAPLAHHPRAMHTPPWLLLEAHELLDVPAARRALGVTEDRCRPSWRCWPVAGRTRWRIRRARADAAPGRSSPGAVPRCPCSPRIGRAGRGPRSRRCGAWTCWWARAATTPCRRPGPRASPGGPRPAPPVRPAGVEAPGVRADLHARGGRGAGEGPPPGPGRGR